MMNFRPGSLLLARPIDVRVPRIVARSVVPKAMNKLLPIAARQRSVPSTTSYQRVEMPASGKVKNDPLLNDSGTGTKIGTMRKIATSAHQVQGNPRRILSPVVG